MNLDKFLNEQTAHSTEQLDEGAREFIQGAANSTSKLLAPILNPLQNLAKRFISSVQRVFFKTVKGATGSNTYAVYEQAAPGGKVLGYMYPDKVLEAMGKSKGGSTKATFLKVYMPSKKKGNAMKVAIDPQFLTNAGKSNAALNAPRVKKPQAVADLPEGSFLNKLGGEVLNEVGIDFDTIDKVSSSGQKAKAFSKKLGATYNSTDIGIPDPSAYVDNDNLNEYISSAKIEIESLSDILKEFLYTLSWRKSLNQPVPSLLLMGFPGGGKTSLINSFGKGRFKVHVLEIASIYKEVLGGFPVVEDVFKDPSLLDDKVAELRGKDELESETRTDYKGEDGVVRTKAVKMKAADLFPEEDGMIHIFFMDEYNRDAEKMAAAMNLMLSGSIGTQYHLPKKTIVIAAGNLGENIDKVKVAKLDSATFDRYDARVLLSRNVQRSLDYSRASTTYGGEKGITRELPKELRLDSIETVDPDKIDEYKIDMGGLNSSLDIFFNVMIEKYGPELMDAGWEKDLSIKPLESEYQKGTDYDDDDEMTYQITPRTVDKMNTRLKNRAMIDWIEASEGIGTGLVKPKSIEKYFLKNETTSRYMNLETPEDWDKVWKKHEDEYRGRGIPSPTALYLHVCQWHPTYIPTILKQILGGSPRKLINNIRQTAYQAVKDANQVSLNDIIFGYVPKKIFGHELVQKDGDGKEIKTTLERDGFVNLVKSINSMKDQVMRNLCDVISKNASDSAIEKMVKTATGKTFAEVKEAIKAGGANVNTPKDLIIFNIVVFMNDTNLTEARAASFIRRLKEFGITVDASKGTTETGESDPGIKAAKAAKEAIAYIYSGLWQLSEVIKNTRFIQSGGDTDELGEGRFKRSKVVKDDTTEMLEEGLRSVFKKML